MKVCSQCKEYLPLENFDIQSTGKHGRRADCKICRKRFIRSEYGLTKSIYDNQIQKSKRRGYSQPTYTEEELFKWINKQPNFKSMYQAWVDSEYLSDFKPSVDRIDDYIGYNLSNIQLMTWKENNNKNYISQKNGVNNKKSIAVDMLTLDGQFIKRFYSVSDAARHINGIASNIIGAINGRISRHKNADGTYRQWAMTQAYGYKWCYSIEPNINKEKI